VFITHSLLLQEEPSVIIYVSIIIQLTTTFHHPLRVH